MATIKWMACTLCPTCEFYSHEMVSSTTHYFKCSAGTTSTINQAYRFPEGTKKDTCPEFKAASTDSSSSSGGGSSGGGAIGAGVVGVVGGMIAGAIANANSAEKAQIEADALRDEKARIAEWQDKCDTEKDINIQKIMSCKFDGDASSIVQELSMIWSIVTENKPPNFFLSSAGPIEINAKKAVYKVGRERMEFGILQLRNKGDMANADYFQTKLDGKKEGLVGFLKKKILGT